MGAEVNCRQASRLLSLGCDRPLSAEESAALELHLSKCLMCRNFDQQLRFFRKAARQFRMGIG